MQHEINIGGIYVSPFVVVLALTLLIFYPLRAFLDHIEFEKYVWHRSLADVCEHRVLGTSGRIHCEAFAALPLSWDRDG